MELRNDSILSPFFNTFYFVLPLRLSVIPFYGKLVSAFSGGAVSDSSLAFSVDCSSDCGASVRYRGNKNFN